MTVSAKHERYKHLVRRLIEGLLDELEWDIAGYGSMTFRRRTKKRGLEPDECFWIQNEPLVRGKDKIDIRRDPPPDLVFEIEVSRSALNRMDIYAALKVPEVWRYAGKSVQVMLLEPNGRYANSETSRAFPFLPIAELARFLEMRSQHSETEIVRKFRAWVRKQVAAGWK